MEAWTHPVTGAEIGTYGILEKLLVFTKSMFSAKGLAQ